MACRCSIIRDIGAPLPVNRHCEVRSTEAIQIGRRTFVDLSIAKPTWIATPLRGSR